MQLKALAVLVLGVAMAAGCSGAAAGSGAAPTSRQPDLTGFTGQTIAWRGCGNGESFQAGGAKATSRPLTTAAPRPEPPQRPATTSGANDAQPDSADQ